MSKEEIVKYSEINIKVGVDHQHNPVKITWKATDMDIPEEREVKAFQLSLWDVKENNSMRIDLWNTEMQVNEMYTFMYQNLVSMSETLERATSDTELANDMKDFAAFFARKTGLGG